MWITRVSIKNPVFATMVMVGITVLGLFSYSAAARRADAGRQRCRSCIDADELSRAPRPRWSRPTSRSRSSTRSTPCPASSLIRSNSARRAGARSSPSSGSATDMTRAMQDVRDKIAQVRPSVPARRQGPAGDPRRDRGEPAAGRVARRACRRRSSCASSPRSPTRRSSRGSRTCPASRRSTSTAA